MKTIYKLGETITIEGQFNNLLTLQLQNNIPYIWMEIDTDRPKMELQLVLVGH